MNLEVTHCLFYRQKAFERAGQIIFKRHRCAEKTDCQTTFVRKIKLFEITAESVELLQNDGRKRVQIVGCFDVFKGNKNGNDIAELAFAVEIDKRIWHKLS